MRTGRPVSVRLGAVLASVAAAVALAACGSSDSPPGDDGGPATGAGTATTDATAAPTGAASPSPSASASTGGSRPAARLLTAPELPPLTAAARWTQGPTGPADSEPVGACNAADLVSIGAKGVVSRTYTSDAAEAVEQVADFPDRMTTVRASRVLASWHDTCGRRVSTLPKLEVGDLQQVGVVGAKGWWYLASWVPSGTAGGHFQSVGAVVGDTTIAFLVVDHAGQDHNYPPGADPMIASVKAAAAKLAGRG